MADRTPNEFAALWQDSLVGGGGERFTPNTLPASQGNPPQGSAPPAHAALGPASTEQADHLTSERSAKLHRPRTIVTQSSLYIAPQAVPWQYAGRAVWVREYGRDVEVHYGQQRIAIHNLAKRKHLVVTQTEHHRGIPLGTRVDQKILVRIQDTAPVVEVRPLAAYENLALGGGQ